MLTWMDRPPLVYVNDTKWLPYPILSKNIPLDSEGTRYNYSGSTVYPPFCMSLIRNDKNNVFCVTRKLQNWIVTNASDNKYMGIGMESIGKEDRIIDPTYKPKPPVTKKVCLDQVEVWHQGLPWSDCSILTPKKVAMPHKFNTKIFNWGPSLHCGIDTVFKCTNNTKSHETWQIPCASNFKKTGFKQAAMSGPGLAMETGPIQNTQWKIMAASKPIRKFQVNVTDDWIQFKNVTYTYITACVFAPYVMLLGDRLSITKNKKGLYEIQCVNCQLNQCIDHRQKNAFVAIMYQPPLVWLPVNLTETWAPTPTLNFVHKTFNHIMHRSKRFVLSIIGALVSLTAIIASLATASAALSYSIQNQAFIQEVVSNSSELWHTQQNLDLAFKDELETLKDAVFWLGKEVEALHTRITYPCHFNHTGFCITPLKYDNISYEWQSVVQHIKGAWGHHNSTLDIIHLQQEINKLDQIVYEQEARKIASEWEETIASLNYKNWFGKINLANIGNYIIISVILIVIIVILKRKCRNKNSIKSTKAMFRVPKYHNIRYQDTRL